MPSQMLMSKFPADASEQVTLGNWRAAPFSHWSFQHVRELIPTANIPNDPTNVWKLVSSPRDFASWSFVHNGESYSLDRFIEDTDTDGLAILHRGELVFEHYANGMTADTPHILMSVTKSVTGLIAGLLVEQGALDYEQPVTSILPELKDSVYANSTVRHVLDMRVNLTDFSENYLATSGPIIEYRKAMNWNPLGPGDEVSDIRSFLRRLAGKDGVDGGPFHYVSPNSDLLSWIIERATGIRYADLVSKLLWKPMGAQDPAYVTVDRLGAARSAGGLCTTLLDLARVGQLIAQDGQRGDISIIPANWISDTFAEGDAAAWDAGDLKAYFNNRRMHYRNKWYVTRDRQMASGLGIHGQNLFIDKPNNIVIAKFSSQSAALNELLVDLTVSFAEAISDSL